MHSRRTIVKSMGILLAGCATGARRRGSAMTRIREAMAGAGGRGGGPGLVWLVGRGGEVEWAAVGSLGRGDAGPMRRDTIFRISSMTKPIAAAAAMSLVEEGRLALDEPAQRFLPELAGRRVLRRIHGPL